MISSLVVGDRTPRFLWFAKKSPIIPHSSGIGERKADEPLQEHE
jgi:hypothetical protein